NLGNNLGNKSGSNLKINIKNILTGKLTCSGGFTYVEFIAVLSIFAGLIIAGFLCAPLVSLEFEKQREEDDMAHVRSAYMSVMAAAKADSTGSAYKSDVVCRDGVYSLEVKLTQRQNGWQSKTPITIAGYSSADNGGSNSNGSWRGQPNLAYGKCTVSFSQYRGVIFDWGDGSTPGYVAEADPSEKSAADSGSDAANADAANSVKGTESAANAANAGTDNSVNNTEGAADGSGTSTEVSETTVQDNSPGARAKVTPTAMKNLTLKLFATRIKDVELNIRDTSNYTKMTTTSPIGAHERETVAAAFGLTNNDAFDALFVRNGTAYTVTIVNAQLAIPSVNIDNVEKYNGIYPARVYTYNSVDGTVNGPANTNVTVTTAYDLGYYYSDIS
ncbi:MAG: hypothetical protein Q4E57_03100, partial [Eubacteriales bacterium]|nr:hypothetical protein [Eubacteriales bacterium]